MPGPTDDAVSVYALAHSVETDDVEFDDAGLAQVASWLALHDASVRAEAFRGLAEFEGLPFMDGVSSASFLSEAITKYAEGVASD